MGFVLIAKKDIISITALQEKIHCCFSSYFFCRRTETLKLPSEELCIYAIYHSLQLLQLARHECDCWNGCSMAADWLPLPPPSSLFRLPQLSVCVSAVPHLSHVFHKNANVAKHFLWIHAKMPVLNQQVLEHTEKVNWLCCGWHFTIAVTNARWTVWVINRAGMKLHLHNICKNVLREYRYTIKRPWLLRRALAEYRQIKTLLHSDLCYSWYIKQTPIEQKHPGETYFIQLSLQNRGGLNISTIKGFCELFNFQSRHFLERRFCRITLPCCVVVIGWSLYVCQWKPKQCCKDNVCPITVCTIGFIIGRKMFKWSLCSSHDRVNQSTQWHQSQPTLMNPQQETWSNCAWCCYGVHSFLEKSLPIISWSENFYGIETITACNFVVARMLRNVT